VTILVYSQRLEFHPLTTQIGQDRVVYKRHQYGHTYHQHVRRLQYCYKQESGWVGTRTTRSDEHPATVARQHVGVSSREWNRSCGSHGADRALVGDLMNAIWFWTVYILNLFK
jgi:hypothetical protein